MIVLFTDFGSDGPYVGQVKRVLHAEAPGVPVVDLFADAPSRDPLAAAYLLAAYAGEFARGSVFLAVVDPGVGGDRPAGVLSADGRWYVGPDNGLFELVARWASAPPRWWHIVWRPEDLSASFHGRDLFAPMAAALARGHGAAWMEERPVVEMRRPGWPDDLLQIVYIDIYGNAMTGVRAETVPTGARLLADNREIGPARTFSDMPAGAPFWYANANGLVEIAVNMGRADRDLNLAVGSPVICRGV